DNAGKDVRADDGHADAAGLQAAILGTMTNLTDPPSAARRVPAGETLSGMEELARALRSLPGVGPKAAQRMALHLLQHDRDGAVRLANALQHAAATVRHCER